MSIIYDEIKKGETGSREKFGEVDAWLRQAGCDCAILGCTELSVYRRSTACPPITWTPWRSWPSRPSSAAANNCETYKQRWGAAPPLRFQSSRKENDYEPHPLPLGDYLQLLQRKNLQLDFSGAPLTREVALVSCDSRQVVPGTLFICKGAHFKVEFLQSAKEQGAFVYLAEKKYDQVDLPCILVSDVRLAMAYLADFYYNHPSSKLGVVGITGTKGKSSTAYYLKYIFDEYLAAKGQPPAG